MCRFSNPLDRKIVISLRANYLHTRSGHRTPTHDSYYQFNRVKAATRCSTRSRVFECRNVRVSIYRRCLSAVSRGPGKILYPPPVRKTQSPYHIVTGACLPPPSLHSFEMVASDTTVPESWYIVRIFLDAQACILHSVQWL